MPRTSRLAVGGPAGETTDFDADYKFSPLERMLLTAAVCTEMPAPPTGRALLLGGGSGPPQQQSAAAGGGVPTPPAAERTDPALPRLFAAAPPPSTLGSCLSGTLEAVVFTAPSSPIHLRRVECWRFTKDL